MGDHTLCRNSDASGRATLLAHCSCLTLPRMQVKGVLDQEEVLFAKNKGYLYGTHVVVGLPECLVEASKAPHAVAIMQHTRAVAVDEVDACFLVSPECLLCVHIMIQFQAEPSVKVCATFWHASCFCAMAVTALQRALEALLQSLSKS